MASRAAQDVFATQGARCMRRGTTSYYSAEIHVVLEVLLLAMLACFVCLPGLPLQDPV
jgi:hypothetical protein